MQTEWGLAIYSHFDERRAQFQNPKNAASAAERIRYMDEEYITEAELSQWLRISKSTLHKLREDGLLPFQRIGSCIRYSRKDLDDWLCDRTFNKEQGGPEDVPSHK